VAKAFGGPKNLAANSPPKLNNVAARLHSSVKGGEGFRIVMDEKETSILVSGTDEYVYLAEKKEGYDLSAPWGSLNITQDVLDFDVFGRLICFSEVDFWRRENHGRALPLRVCNPKRVPRRHKVA
jgi:hypothetical protein